MATKKEVLIYGDRKRPIMFEQSEDPKEERIRLLEAVKVAFSDLIGEGKGMDIWNAICIKNRNPVNVTFYFKRNVEIL